MKKRYDVGRNGKKERERERERGMRARRKYMKKAQGRRKETAGGRSNKMLRYS